MTAVTPTILLILDGWGLAPEGPGNAARLANTPTLDNILKHPSRTEIEASGRAVGLPPGYMGNSEVGHMNLGAGRIVNQDMTLIDLAMENGEFATNPVIGELLATTGAAGGKLHLMGLLSDGGVHSHINHVECLIQTAKHASVPLVLHAFMDGRDTSPTSGIAFIRRIRSFMARERHGSLGSMTGRYYAMDRDKHWERNIIAWNALVHGEGDIVADPEQALAAAYAAGETDEFLKPRLLRDADGKPHVIRDNDSVFFFNFRADRARQLSRIFLDPSFAEFNRRTCPSLAGFAAFTHYDNTLPIPAAFEKPNLDHCLGEVVANMGLRQLRIAETEKYAHVTYFFNCGREDPFAGEERRLIPSPRDVATYDQQPQMSAAAVTDALLREWENGGYAFIVCNLANPDMVGHTGSIPAAVAACETVDACTARIMEAVRRKKGRLFLTADHGNVEEMLAPDGNPHTAHTTNMVALTVLDDGPAKKLKKGGKLGDVAPTILRLWGVAPPREMTGASLWEEK